MARLLVVEDEESIAEPLRQLLERDGYAVTHVRTGAEALDRLDAERYDLLLLDLGLPDGDGLDVCRQARRVDPDLRVVILTARSEELDTVVGLDAGADDYITKPFAVAELLARLRSQFRRHSEQQHGNRRVRVDVQARRAWLDSRPLELTAKEFDLLATLVASEGVVLTRRQLMAEVWDQHWDGSTKTLDIHISVLRRKLGDDPSDPSFIVTVRGVGYRYESH
jgi:DNA-binding response OmpR family regulator